MDCHKRFNIYHEDLPQYIKIIKQSMLREKHNQIQQTSEQKIKHKTYIFWGEKGASNHEYVIKTYKPFPD